MAVKYILGWILPGMICGAGILLLYKDGIKQYVLFNQIGQVKTCVVPYKLKNTDKPVFQYSLFQYYIMSFL